MTQDSTRIAIVTGASRGIGARLIRIIAPVKMVLDAAIFSRREQGLESH